MRIEEFADLAVSRVKEKMGMGVTVSSKCVRKNNGVILHGIEIAEKGSNIAPCIYLDRWHDRYEAGEDIEIIMDGIIRSFEDGRKRAMPDISDFENFEAVRGKIYGRLVNTEKNAEVLTDIPNRAFLDLSLIYCVVLSIGEEVGSIMVRNSHMEAWGVSEDDLYREAMSNMETADDAIIKSFTEIMKEMAGDGLPLCPDSFPMYVLTNRCKVNGAVEITRKDVLEKAAEIMGCDFMVIPSSVHEVLLVPDNRNPKQAAQIAGMVDEVNRTQVAEDEVLSFHVYRYSRRDGGLSVAA